MLVDEGHPRVVHKIDWLCCVVERLSLEVAAFEVDCDGSGWLDVVSEAVSALTLEEVKICLG